MRFIIHRIFAFHSTAFFVALSVSLFVAALPELSLNSNIAHAANTEIDLDDLEPSEREEELEFREANYRAQLVLMNTGTRIPKLGFISKRPKIRRTRIGDGDDDEGEFEYVTHVRGRYKREEWSLTVDGKPVQTDPKTGRFSLKTKFETNQKFYQFLAIGPRGQVQRQTLKVSVPRWTEMTAKPEQYDPAIKNHFISPGIGFTGIALTDDRIGSYWGVNLTGKGSYRYRFLPKWDFGISSYVTIQAISASQPEPAHFWGVNGRIGYHTSWLPEPWHLDFLFGGYFVTMFVDDDSYGFKNLSGPQIFPTIRRQTSSGNFISFYFKFSPINDKFGFLGIENREIAAGVAYIIPLKTSSTALDFSLNVSDLVVVLSGVKITVRTASLGFGLSM